VGAHDLFHALAPDAHTLAPQLEPLPGEPRVAANSCAARILTI
jgi:hypothetical protein